MPDIDFTSENEINSHILLDTRSSDNNIKGHVMFGFPFHDFSPFLGLEGGHLSYPAFH